jgi:hypothetical protein
LALRRGVAGQQALLGFRNKIRFSVDSPTAGDNNAATDPDDDAEESQ